MTTNLLHETKIGRHLYPLRAIALAMVLGATVAILFVVAVTAVAAAKAGGA